MPPPDIFSASQELLAARVNATIGSSKGAECGTVTSTAIMAQDANVLLARIRTSKACSLSLSLTSPNMYGIPITVGSSANTLTMARENNKWNYNDATLTEFTTSGAQPVELQRCDADRVHHQWGTLVVNSAALRDFVLPTVQSSFGSLVDGSSKNSCMWLTDDSSNHSHTKAAAGSYPSPGVARKALPGRSVTYCVLSGGQRQPPRSDGDRSDPAVPIDREG